MKQCVDFKENQIQKVEWVASVPIFRNKIILKQLGLAIGIPFGLVVLFMFFSSSEDQRIYAFYGSGLIIATLLLTYIFVQLLYGGKYEVGFIVDEKGIISYTQNKQARQNKAVNSITAILGLLTRKPAVAGAAVLAQSRQRVMIKWKSLRKVKYHPKVHTIMVKGGFAENIALFCTKENYIEVEKIIKSKTKIL
jgi:hypothetical protein